LSQCGTKVEPYCVEFVFLFII